MKHIIKIIIVSLVSTLVFTANAFSEKIALNGTIKGANCVINKAYCPVDNSDPHIALENTFVLVDDTGGYYFLSNLGKIKKMALLNKNIHVKGESSGQTIAVNSVYNMENDKVTHKIWDWSEIRKRMLRN